MGEYVQSEFGKLYTEGDEVFVRTKDGGRFTAIGREGAESLLASGEMVPATADEVAERQAQNRSGGVGGAVGAAAEGAAAGFFDAALAIPKLATATAAATGLTPDDPLAGVSGRGTVAAARGLAAELGGGELGVAEREYSEQARERAVVNPLASGAGYAAGTIAGSGLTMAAGAGVARAAGGLGKFGSTAAQFAAEGAIEGAAATSEQAFIEDHELTAEQMWAGAGIGAAFGVGLAGVGALARGGSNRLRKVFGKADDVPVQSIGDDVLEETIEKSLGQKPTPGALAKIRDYFEEAQKVAIGASKSEGDTISTYGAGRWNAKARRGRDLFENREELIDDASIDIARRLDSVKEDAEDILFDAVNGQARKERLKELVRDDAIDAQRDMARRHMRAAIELSDDIAPVAEKLEGETDKAFRRRIKDRDKALNITFGNRAAREGDSNYIRQLQAQLEEAQNPEDIFSVADELKRTIQKTTKGLREKAVASKKQGEQVQMRNLADRMEAVEKPLLRDLENEDVWGAAGQWQRNKNAAWHEYINSAREFNMNLTRQVEGINYKTGRNVYRADPGKVKSFIQKLGTADGVIPEEYVSKHIAKTKELTAAIADLGAESKFAQQLNDIKKSYESIEQSLVDAQDTIKVANQIAALEKREKQGALGAVMAGATFGGVVGGIPGAVAGGVLGALKNPAKLMHQANAVYKMAKQVDARTDGAIGRFFSSKKGPTIKAAGVSKPKLRMPKMPSIETGLKGKTQIPRAATIAFALPGKSNQQSYQKRAEEIQTVIASRGQSIMDYSAQNLSGIASEMPRTHIAMAGKAMAAAQYLHSKLPPIEADPELKRLGVVPPPDQLDEFKTAWETVMDPLSVLDQLENGFIHPDAVEALKTVYPRMWQSIRDKAMTALLSQPEPPTLAARAQLDLLFEMNGAIEPSLSPERLARNAPLNELRMSQIEPTNAPPPGRRAPDMASNYQTTLGRIS